MTWVPRYHPTNRNVWMPFEDEFEAWDDHQFVSQAECTVYCNGLTRGQFSPMILADPSEFTDDGRRTEGPWWVRVERDHHHDRTYYAVNVLTGARGSVSFPDQDEAISYVETLNEARGITDRVERLTEGAGYRPVPVQQEHQDETQRLTEMERQMIGDQSSMPEPWEPVDPLLIDVDGVAISMVIGGTPRAPTYRIDWERGPADTFTVDGSDSRFSGISAGEYVRAFDRDWVVTRRLSRGRSYVRPLPDDARTLVMSYFDNDPHAVWASEADSIILHHEGMDWRATSLTPQFGESDMEHGVVTLGGMDFTISAVQNDRAVRLLRASEEIARDTPEGPVRHFDQQNTISMDIDIEHELIHADSVIRSRAPIVGRVTESVSFDAVGTLVGGLDVNDRITVLMDGVTRMAVVTGLTINSIDGDEIIHVEGRLLPVEEATTTDQRAVIPTHDREIIEIGCGDEYISGDITIEQSLQHGNDCFRVYVTLAVNQEVFEEHWAGRLAEGTLCKLVQQGAGASMPNMLFRITGVDRDVLTRRVLFALRGCSDIFDPGVNLTEEHVGGDIARVRDLSFLRQVQAQSRRSTPMRMQPMGSTGQRRVSPDDVTAQLIGQVEFREESDCFQLLGARFVGSNDESMNFDIAKLNANDFVQVNNVVYLLRSVRTTGDSTEVLMEIASGSERVPMRFSRGALTISKDKADSHGRPERSVDVYYVMQDGVRFCGGFGDLGAARSALVMLAHLALGNPFDEDGTLGSGGRAVDMRTDVIKSRDARLEALEAAGRDLCSRFRMVVERPGKNRHEWQVEGIIGTGELARAEGLFWAGVDGYEAPTTEEIAKVRDSRPRAMQMRSETTRRPGK